MLSVRTKLSERVAHHGTLTLPFDLRQKSRLRSRLGDGTEVGLVLPRGTVLRDGDLLEADDKTVIRVCAAPEQVSTATAPTPLLLLRAAYHLGNRHVPLDITIDRLRYQHDHVLDRMLSDLGLTITVEQAPFEPEAGAYGAAGALHGHGHPHG